MMRVCAERRYVVTMSNVNVTNAVDISLALTGAP